jgi:hypothetical protein
MKRKHRPAEPEIKVITDARKLAWLQAQIEKKKAQQPYQERAEKIRHK